MNRVFITGCAGFIGYHLAKRLGDCVVGYDNFNDYYSPKLKRDRVERLGVEVIEGDICDEGLVEKIRGCSHVVHLAAQAGVRYSVTHPGAYVKSNLEGFVNVLEACRKLELPLIYASSSSVYGLNEKVPFRESDKTDRQASLYGATKKANELLAHSYHHLYGIPMTGLRFFTVYGPWGRPDMAYYKFAKKIVDGEEIEIYNGGEMMRDFTYVDDIVDGVVAAIEGCSGYDVYNLGNNKPVALMDFIGVLEDALGEKAKKKFLPMQQGDVKMTYACVKESKKRLNFEPKTSIEEGISHFVDWFKSYSCLELR